MEGIGTSKNRSGYRISDSWKMAWKEKKNIKKELALIEPTQKNVFNAHVKCCDGAVHIIQYTEVGASNVLDLFLKYK